MTDRPILERQSRALRKLPVVVMAIGASDLAVEGRTVEEKIARYHEDAARARAEMAVSPLPRIEAVLDHFNRDPVRLVPVLTNTNHPNDTACLEPLIEEFIESRGGSCHAVQIDAPANDLHAVFNACVPGLGDTLDREAEVIVGHGGGTPQLALSVLLVTAALASPTTPVTVISIIEGVQDGLPQVANLQIRDLTRGAVLRGPLLARLELLLRDVRVHEAERVVDVLAQCTEDDDTNAARGFVKAARFLEDRRLGAEPGDIADQYLGNWRPATDGEKRQLSVLVLARSARRAADSGSWRAPDLMYKLVTQANPKLTELRDVRHWVRDLACSRQRKAFSVVDTMLKPRMALWHRSDRPSFPPEQPPNREFAAWHEVVDAVADAFEIAHDADPVGDLVGQAVARLRLIRTSHRAEARTRTIALVVLGRQSFELGADARSLRELGDSIVDAQSARALLKRVRASIEAASAAPDEVWLIGTDQPPNIEKRRDDTGPLAVSVASHLDCVVAKVLPGALTELRTSVEQVVAEAALSDGVGRLLLVDSAGPKELRIPLALAALSRHPSVDVEVVGDPRARTAAFDAGIATAGVRALVARPLAIADCMAQADFAGFAELCGDDDDARALADVGAALSFGWRVVLPACAAAALGEPFRTLADELQRMLDIERDSGELEALLWSADCWERRGDTTLIASALARAHELLNGNGALSGRNQHAHDVLVPDDVGILVGDFRRRYGVGPNELLVTAMEPRACATNPIESLLDWMRDRAYAVAATESPLGV